ncbi:mandelate racemase/muconate lactonizing enzyme family protein [bacterium LRH843]|nr:mandelate racemase/muconate lactonizing enzyme family protein [bacterium LRH843]
MKITSVDVIELKVNRGEPMPHPVGAWRPVVCRINTDEGIYGYGEVALAFGIAAPAAIGMLEDLAGLIIGMNPLDNEVIWDKLYKSTFWGQNGGPVVFGGISAIDIALWDIKGKFFDVPVSQLLGGKRREKLRSYASQLHYACDSKVITVSKTEQDYVNAAKMAAAEGYNAVKVNPFVFDRDGRPFSSEEQTGILSPYYLNLIEERIAAVREGLGKDGDIIAEFYGFTDAQSIVQIAKRIEKYDIMCIEEPSTATPKITKYIHDNINIPIASGERIYTRWQYAQYFEDGSLGMIQPDLGTCGGFTEVKKIVDMAYTYDIGYQAHVAGSPLLTAAALQIESVVPNFVIHEHHPFNKLQFNKELCVHDYQPVNGYFEVPDLPGIGNELSELAIRNSNIITIKE